MPLRTDRRKLTGLLLAVAAAAVLAVVYIWRGAVLSPTLPVSTDLMTAAQFRAHGQRMYKERRLAPLSGIASPSEVEGVWRSVASRGSRPADVDELLEFISEFVWYRYCQNDVDEYKRWRRARGYQLRDAEYLRDKMMVGSDYEYLFKEPYPGNAQINQVFDRFWTTVLSLEGRGQPRSGRIMAIAADPIAIEVAFGAVTRENPASYPLLSGGVRGLWYGSHQGTLRNWWEPKGGDLAAALQRVSPIEFAVVGMIMEYANQERRPTLYGFWRDPVTRKWNHAWITNNNTDGFISGTEY